MTDHLPKSEDRPRVEPPLWSIGFAVLVILTAPMILYAIAPSGPIREGDTVFSSGAHKVRLSQPVEYATIGRETTCLLDPDDPLIVTQQPSEGPEGVIVAQIQGKHTVEWPFCPPQAEILVKPSQVSQKSHFMNNLRDRLTRLFESSR